MFVLMGMVVMCNVLCIKGSLALQVTLSVPLQDLDVELSQEASPA